MTREARLVLRRIPGYVWVQPFILWRPHTRQIPRDQWLYRGFVRQRTVKLGPLAFGYMAMPDRSEES